MSQADQENLLPLGERGSQDGNTNFRYNNTGNNYFGPKSAFRRNLLLLTISLLIATCLTIYIYLDYVAINGFSIGSTGDDQSDHQTRYKPLSRRKPILDHESFFSDSGASMLKVSDLLAHCTVALQIGGEKVVRLSLKNNSKLNQIGSKGKTREGVEDVVTGADMQSHEAILNTIKDSYRRLKVVSEEDTTSAFENLKMEDDILPVERKSFASMVRSVLLEIEGDEKMINNWPLIAQHETLVWIDPLDATKEYSENLTEYVTLMACIVHKNVPIGGVSHKPFLNMTFWSLEDKDQRKVIYSPDLLNAWSQNDLDKGNSLNQNTKIIVSRSHAGDVRNLLDNKYEKQLEIISAGGSGYKTIELIKGQVEAYVHVTHIKKWDICAPHAILNSLPSGRMTDLKGDDINFGNPDDKVVKNGLIATLKQNLHAELVESLKDYKP